MVNYECKSCNYRTTRLNNWRQHLKTEKHLKKRLVCNNCGKEYKYRSGLSKHMNTCKAVKNIVVNNTIINNYNNITFQVFLDKNCKNAIDIDELLEKLMFTKKELLKIADNKGQLESLKANLDSQKMLQEAEIKKQLMQIEFNYNMQLRSIDAEAKKTNEKEKEDRKDERTKIQATQQSEMIDQRNSGKPPKNFESSGNDILGGGFDLGSFDPR